MGQPLKSQPPENYRQFFGRRLQGFRRTRFQTQQEFCDALNSAGVAVTRAQISHWERGFRMPEIQQLPVIAELLAISLDQLVPHPRQFRRREG